MPNTIADNLLRLQTARTAIATAITAKGGTVTQGDGFEEFPADIATIPSGGGTVRSGIIASSANISNLTGNVYRIGNIVFGSFSGDVQESLIISASAKVSVLVTDLGYDSERADTSIPFTGCAFARVPVYSPVHGYGSSTLSYSTGQGDHGKVIFITFSNFKGSGGTSTTMMQPINGTFYFSW